MPCKVPWLVLFSAAIAIFGQSQTKERTAGLDPEIQSHFASAQQAQANQDYITAEKEYLKVVELAPRFAEAHMNLGLTHQLQGHEVEAMASFKSALKLNPSLTGANFFLGVNYCKQGNGTAAIPYLKAAIAQQPQQVEFLSWLATAQDLAGQWQDEIVTLKRALELQPRSVNLLYLLGQAYERVAKQHALDLKKNAPDSSRAEEMVAESYSSSNEWPSAVIHFENALAKSPNAPRLHLKLGEVYLHAGKLKQALAEFEAELAAYPNSLCALVRRGEVKLLRGQTAEALKDWQRALETDSLQTVRILGMRETGFGDAAFEQLPEAATVRLEQVADELQEGTTPIAEFAKAFIGMQTGKTEPTAAADIPESRVHSCSQNKIAILLEEERFSALSGCVGQVLQLQFPPARRVQIAGALVLAGEYESAIRILDSVPPAQKRSPEVSYWRARCYQKLATAAYLLMYQVDPNSFRVHQLLGDLASTRNDDGKAIEEYRAAVFLNPNAPNLHYSLGHILWKVLKVAEARVELEAELKINPRHAGALHDLGDTYLLERQPEKALPYLQRAVTAYPSNPDIHRDLGTAYSQLEDYARAAEEYKIGIANDQDGSVHYKLAKVYQALGQKEYAKREFDIYTAMNRETHAKLEKRGQRLANIERAAE